MTKIKAIVVGVSYYSFDGASDLPFCIDDITAITTALKKGLKTSSEDITSCGSLGYL